MSLASALNSALTGLSITARQTEIVSNNIANAADESYGRRELALSSNVVTSGVRIVGVVRNSDPAVLSERRSAEAGNGADILRAEFLAAAERLTGKPEDAFSLAGRLTALETGLVSAASAPESGQRLNTVATRAAELSTALNTATSGLNTLRNAADRSIGLQVDTLNTALSRLETLNEQIARAGAAGEETPAHLDQRQKLVDQINAIVPINIAPRENGRIALYTNQGTVLIDGPAAEIGYETTFTTTPELTIENGRLSGLTINGIALRTGSDNGALRGGTLAAQFEIRDELAPRLQADLDAMARDLIERFQDPAVDPSLGIGDAGLFTDGASALDPLAEVGLAGRIRLNAAVDPDQGGQAWRLRSGLNAAAPGPVGDASLLQAWETALTARRSPASGPFDANPVTALDFASTVMSQVAHRRLTADEHLSFSSSTLSEIKKIELGGGVDTDAEIQNLLTIETAYAANARVIQTIDDMMQTLLRLG